MTSTSDMHVKVTLTCEHCHNSSTQAAGLLTAFQLTRYYEHHRKCAELPRNAVFQLKDEIAERALRILYLFQKYPVDSRGPSGLLLDIIQKARPDIGDDLAKPGSYSEIYHKHFDDERAGDVPSSTKADTEGPRGSDTRVNPYVNPYYEAGRTGPPPPAPPVLSDLQEARRLLRSWVNVRDPAELHDAICCVVTHLEELEKKQGGPQ